MATLNTALKMVMTPGFEQNTRAQNIVGRILELTNAMSPVEYYAAGQNQEQQQMQMQQQQQMAAPQQSTPQMSPQMVGQGEMVQ